MKIKTIDKPFGEVMALPRPKYQKPHRPNLLFRTLLRIVSTPDLWATRFRCRRIGMEKLGKREPCLVLMNHASFIDLKIASTVLYPRPFNIVCTADGLVGKKWLMRQLGCIPTQKIRGRHPPCAGYGARVAQGEKLGAHVPRGRI